MRRALRLFRKNTGLTALLGRQHLDSDVLDRWFFALLSLISGGPEARPGLRSRLLGDPGGPIGVEEPLRNGLFSVCFEKR